jgi:small subunit ribosomal protein S15
MALNSAEKANILKESQLHPTDTGSSESQISILTHDINKLQSHFAENKKDNHSRRGLIGKVNLRRKLLKYLNTESKPRYQALIAKLGLRK